MKEEKQSKFLSKYPSVSGNLEVCMNQLLVISSQIDKEEEDAEDDEKETEENTIEK